MRDTTAKRDALAEPKEVSDHLKIPLATLSVWRHRGLGPPYRRVGRHVRYRWSDVDKWLESQAGGGRVA